MEKNKPIQSDSMNLIIFLDSYQKNRNKRNLFKLNSFIMGINRF